MLQAAVDPLVSIATLAAAASAFGGRFDGACLILSLLVFALTFPGSLARETGSAGELMLDIVTGWVAIVGLLVLLGWASRTLGAFDQRMLLAWALSTPIALFAAHRALPQILPRILAVEGLRKNAVIAGANDLGRGLAARLRASHVHGVRFVGYFDDRGSNRINEKVLGPLSALGDYVRANNIEIIYIALPMASQPRILKILEELHDTTCSIYFVPDIFVFDLIQARVDSIGDLPVVAVCETPFYGFNGLIKRLSDFILASAILVLITPILIAIGIGVKMSSPGPILFKQRRYGVDGRKIVVYKFRTMTVAEDGDVVRQATKNDARITKFGAFLRKTSLDELPQFINVLQGRMSVVGPRPHAVAHNELYRKLIRGYMIRHKVRPGITGLAQVNGFRGETETVDKMKGRIEYDLAYLRNWSVLLDLQIVLKTVVVVLRKQNAY
ncbi:MAG: undecaprenyl-phosphate glucose phosphotransferase [Betaproteobacteria bacterium]|nr:undecaprenyl-phosphate glucose phosphotransferase [Betaproteobacteria bacterium]MBV9360863.1 undecaprenyl-phosphate glucose phosphotransferase [Betaproteobacteria bacterium]